MLRERSIFYEIGKNRARIRFLSRVRPDRRGLLGGSALGIPMQDPEAGLGPRRSKNRPKLGCGEPKELGRSSKVYRVQEILKSYTVLQRPSVVPTKR